MVLVNNIVVDVDVNGEEVCCWLVEVVNVLLLLLDELVRMLIVVRVSVVVSVLNDANHKS